jgi:hypothetical protein
MVLVGPKTSDELVEYIGKVKNLQPKFYEAIEGLESQKETYKKGCCYSFEGFPPVLVFPSYNQKNPEDVACIVHETSHAVDALSDCCSLNGEKETRAYLHEFLFTAIKSELDKLCDPKKS